MAASFEIKIYENQKLVYTHEFGEPVELGRQKRFDETLFRAARDGQSWRVAVTRLEEQTVPRQFVLLEPLNAERIRLTNLSDRSGLSILSHAPLAPKGMVDLPLPAVLQLGSKVVRVEPMSQDDGPMESLAQAPVPPGGGSQLASSVFATMGGFPASRDLESFETLVRSLQSTVDVLTGAVTSADCFNRAAQAMITLVGLDTARVLVLDNAEWKQLALATLSGKMDLASIRAPSRLILHRVREEKRTFWQRPGPRSAAESSLEGVYAVIASPILNRDGEIIGVLYGELLEKVALPVARSISRMEALLVELIGSAVQAGLARMEQERTIMAARVRFEQFFTKDLSLQLEAQPDLLEGRDARVALLFCDIRRFSHLSGRLSPRTTLEWINSVMSTLSDCVLAQQGVLVDYLGDEIMAMWGAPKPQPDQGRLACLAALAMHDQLPPLNERWQSTLPEAMRFGIGINVGEARVGNTGSRQKFKYGPLGNMVNLASRVQGATKYFKCQILITGEVRADLDDSFCTRRLGSVRVMNIDEPVMLHELAPAGRPEWTTVKGAYEEALGQFESRNFTATTRILGKLLNSFPEDGPSLVLLSRAVSYQLEEPELFSPVWDLPGK